MLQLHESVTRLESLLLIPSQGDENETDSDSEGFMTDQQQEDQDFQEATALLLSPDGKASSSGMVRSPLALDESEPAFPASPSPSRPRRRRRSSPTVRRHLSGTSHRLGGSNTAGPGRTIAPPLLPLPQRIGRTAAEYAQLGFLRGRARAEGLHAFVDGLESVRPTK